MINENGKLNILYISNLTGNLYAGPNHSVPAQIKAQSKYDNVLWYNINNVKRDEWMKDGLDCKNLVDYPSGHLKDLPKPFNKPDIAIVEEFYCYPFNVIINDIIKFKIPFIIIPRSEMTRQAQSKKKFKKRIGNFLYFNKFASKALAIQYLTEQEFKDSSKGWNDSCFVIPNGTNAASSIKNKFNEDRIEAIYIGRYEIYQKGLDILFEAIVDLKEYLIKEKFLLRMYGVNQEGTVEELQKIIHENGLDNLIEINDAIFGEEKIEKLLKADVFVMTSRFEGMPMGMIEALSLGLPCLASKGTNLTNAIFKYDAGWIADNTKESVVNALTEMVKEKKSFKEMSERAVSLANQYSWDVLAKKSHLKFMELLNK